MWGCEGEEGEEFLCCMTSVRNVKNANAAKTTVCSFLYFNLNAEIPIRDFHGCC